MCVCVCVCLLCTVSTCMLIHTYMCVHTYVVVSACLLVMCDVFPVLQMDVDFDPTSTPAGGSTETYIVSFRNKKSNKLSKFAEAVSSQKPYHDPGTLNPL